MDITFKAIKAVENNIIKEGITQGIQHAMEKTIQFYNRKVEKEQQMQHSAGNNGSNMALSSNQQGIPGKVIFTIDNLLPRYRTCLHLNNLCLILMQIYPFSDMPFTDYRLESFCMYLLRNQVKDRIILELCLLEQFSLPGLDAQNDQVG